MVARAPRRFQNSAMISEPSNAPAVSPRSENAAFNTNVTSRVSHAVPTSTAAQNTVEILLNRRKYSSSRPFTICFTKSIVETDANDVIAELIDDIAADKIATIKNPFKMCGTSVIIKIGKMKSLDLIPGRASGSGI